MGTLRKNLFPIFFMFLGWVTGVAATTALGLLPSGQAVDRPADRGPTMQPPHSGHIFTEVSRGRLGVSIQEVTPGLAKEFGLPEPKGALIGEVQPESPAEKAGLKRGDIILEFNGKEIHKAGQLRNWVASAPVGSQSKATIFRDKQQIEIEVALNEQSQEMGQGGTEREESRTALAGVKVMNLNPDGAGEIDRPPRSGVVVDRVHPDSRAREAGLRRGDIILEVNRSPVKNIDDYNETLSNLKKDEGALLLIHRRGRTLFLSVGSA